jgi:hypothetical protein
MIKAPDELLMMQVGPSNVRENLRRAIESGRVVENDDGSLELTRAPKSNVSWMYVLHGPSMHCGFLMHFMFDHVYAESAVPTGCSACYKVKVVLRTLRQLVAVWELGKRINCRSKWGVDLNNPYSQDIYAGYFYVTSLDSARTLYGVVRAVLDVDPKLGREVTLTIKRGCSEYETKIGPSDQFTFAPEMAELEANLKNRFREQKSDRQPSLVLAHWIETAFRIGDDTYLDFTGGERLRRKALTYDPATD